MSNAKLIWIIVFIAGAAGLVITGIRGAGTGYVFEEVTTYQQFVSDQDPGKTEWKPVGADTEQEMREKGYSPTDAPQETLTIQRARDPRAYHEEQKALTTDGTAPAPGTGTGTGPTAQTIFFSWPRTIGIWLAGLLTLCVLSFLWGDNFFYKMAESLVIGTSAAYVMVSAFWPNIVEMLMGHIVPGVIKAWSHPGLNSEFTWYYIFPGIMCVLLLWRLSPKGGWIARWPLAFFIGATAGFRLIGHLESDFTEQVRAAIVPLIVINDAATGGGREFDFWGTVTNLIMVGGTLVTLVYFFFSIEHKGIVGRTARAGIWFLMITFGAAFGYTVMGRIALIAERFQFLVDDWLWIIDPTGKRLVETAGLILGM